MKHPCTLAVSVTCLVVPLCDALSLGSMKSRRQWLSSAFTLVVAPAGVHAQGGAEVRGTPVTPFNSLAFQYRGGDFGGLRASELDEPSVTYKDFVERLKKREVDFVEFMAPSGDAAYVKFKGDSSSIRIGEGYPIEQADGWSSPAFAVRTVKDAGVPYKFTVPALKKYQ